MITQSPHTTLEDAILNALKQGARNRGELFDLTGKPYAVLVPALNSLSSRELIESYFQLQDHLSVLTYRLRPQNPFHQFLEQPRSGSGGWFG